MNKICCGVEWTEGNAAIQQEGPHRVARCPLCNKWLAALPGDPAAFVMPFGKHKGKPVSSMWEEDPDYCRWLMEQDFVRPRLREVLEGTHP